MTRIIALSLFFLSFTLKANISATIDMDKPNVGDHVGLSIIVEGSLDEELEFPEIADIDIIQSGTSSSLSYINGNMSKTVTYSYTLIPLKEGELRIPSIKASISGSIFQTEPYVLYVQAPSSKVYGKKRKSSNSSQGDESDQSSNKKNKGPEEEDLPVAFVTRSFSKSNVVVGEPDFFSIIKFYYAVEVQNFRQKPSELDAFRYFDFKEEMKKERYKGKMYNVFILKRLLLPVKSGSYDIEPFFMSIDLLSERKGGSQPRRRSMFDNFFGGSRYQATKKSFVTGKDKIIVKPIPMNGRPKDYKGLVGSFYMEAKLSDTELTAGDTTTLTITITGLGALDSASKPKIKLPNSIKIYPDKPESKEMLDPEKGLISQKIYKYALVPTQKGSYDLGTYKESYFDFKQGSFQTFGASLGSLEVSGEDVSGVGVSGKGPAETKKTVKELSFDLIDIKRKVTVLPAEKNLWNFDNFLFYLTSFFGLFYVFLFLLPRLSFLTPKMTAGKRKAMAYKLYKEKRKKLVGAKATTEEEQLKFAEAVSSLFKSFLADKFDLNASSLTPRELSNSLEKSNCSSELKTDILALFQSLEKISFGYARASSTANEENFKLTQILVKKVENHV